MTSKFEKSWNGTRWIASTWCRVKCEAKKLKRDLTTLWYASKDVRIPLSAKALALLVLAMALSPIDIIPDFIPILGLLDDIVLIPLGIWIVIKLM